VKCRVARERTSPPAAVRLLVGGVLALGLASWGCGRHETPLLPTAPPFALSDLGGRTVSLADFAGRIVVIDFWATWCEPCVHQIPVLNDVQRERARDGVVVLGVSLDVDTDAVAPFAAEHHIEYPVLLGSHELAHDYGAPGVPALVVVDREGRLASLHLGVTTPEEIAEAIAAADS
jgi:peroxiredoxin